jgi:hypothetical protein
VVAIVNSGTSRNPQAMNLMRCLAFLSAKGDFRIQAAHIRGSHNIVADARFPQQEHVQHGWWDWCGVWVGL